jgi:membrane-associated protease RseP (regulator of RpoE activity)
MVSRGNKTLRLDVVLGDRGRIVPPEPPQPLAVPEIPGLPELADRLGELPDLSDLDSALPRVRNYVIEFSGARQLGIDVIDITPDLGEKFAVREGYGLLVSRVAAGSAAGKGGLKAGDVIVRANDSPLRSAADLRRTLDALQDREAVLLSLYRDGQLRKFSLVPDNNEKRVWDVRRFTQTMENLKGNISDEAKAMLQEEIRKLKMAKQKEFAELQKEEQRSLKQAREKSRDLARALKRLQAEKNKLADEAGKKIAEELRKIQEGLRKIEEKIRAEEEREKGKERD